MDRIFEQKGFSLTEVLLSLGILTVAMLFIAGVFPVGIHYATVSTDRTTAAVVADEAFAKLRLCYDDICYDDITPLDQALDLLQNIPPPPLDPAFPAFTFSRDVNEVCLINEPGFWDWQGFWRQYEYFYPSVIYDSRPVSPKPKYTWAAILRRLGPDPRQVQATVFVCRYLGPDARYYRRFPWLPPFPWLPLLSGPPGVLDATCLHLLPVPVFVRVRQPLDLLNNDELLIFDLLPDDSIEEKTFINDGCTIVDDETGRIYRVLERYPADPATALPADQIIRLDKPFVPGDAFINPNIGNYSGKVWVIPPRVDRTKLGITNPPPPVGRSPCVAVYQRIIRF